jgi:hypothetical protein
LIGKGTKNIILKAFSGGNTWGHAKGDMSLQQATPAAMLSAL